MIRALFVDDEPAILEGLENRLRRLRGRWKISFASSGEAALAKLAQDPYDVIISDMRMPGMDGAELFERVRKTHPGIVRIILSGQTDKEPMLMSLPVAHQILSKPCDAQILEAAVERARALHSVLDNEPVRQAIAGITGLPPLSRVYNELTSALENPEVRLAEIAALIEQEGALTARILQFANSAFIGLGRSVNSAQEAVKFLGLATLRGVVTSLELFAQLEQSPPVPGFSLAAVHTHSLRTARLAAQLVDPDKDTDRRTAFSAAILHDIGSLLLATSLPDFYPPALECARKEGIPLHLAEQRVHGFTHAEAGGYLLALWGLPHPIVEAVAHHHHPARTQEDTFRAAGAVHVADRLCHDSRARADGIAFEVAHAGSLDIEYLERVHVRDKIPAWRELAARELVDPSA